MDAQYVAPDYRDATYLAAVRAGEVDDRATLYALRVGAGEIVAGPYVRAACQRHLRDLAEGHGRGLRWDLPAAQRAMGFIQDVLQIPVAQRDAQTGEVHYRSAPFRLELWQAFIVGSLFGWKNERNLRRFRRAYVEIAKGNGKTPLAAAIALYMLTAQRKANAEVFSAASMLDQADRAFQVAVQMWERSPALRRRLIARGDKRVLQLSFIDPRTKRPAGFMKPISAEKKGKSGPEVFCAIIDEVHEHPDMTVIEMMRAGTKGNEEALIFEITNSGFDKKSVCGQEHDTSVRVVAGEENNDAWFAYIACLDDDDEPFEDESCWIKANPNLGVSIHPPYIREQVDEARILPSKEGIVRRLNFCQWTDSEKAAIPRDVWEACETEVDPDALHAAGYRCFGGLDLAQVNDLCAFTLTWLPVETKDQWEFVSKTWFWMARDNLVANSKRDHAPYDVWAKQGLIDAPSGKALKFGYLADALLDLCARYTPVIIGADNYGLKQLNEKLSELGQTLPCQVHPQGFRHRKLGEVAELKGTGSEDIELSMPDSINKLELAFLERRIKVDRHPVMRMCSRGVVFTQNKIGDRMFDKDKATTRIDGMISLAMSIGVATVTAPALSAGSYLDREELLVM